MDSFIHSVLSQYGYSDLERHLNEWNNAHERTMNGTSYASAATAAMLSAMQESHTDMLCYYDTRLGGGSYGGLFDPLSYEPTCAYYTFYAFGKLYALKNQAETTVDDADGLYVTAAADGEKKGVIITNFSEEPIDVETNLSGSFDSYLINGDNHYIATKINTESFTLAPNTVMFIENK